MLKIILPILTLVGAVFLAKYLIATGPKARKKPFVRKLPVVEVQKLKSQNYTVNLKASGIVRAGIKTNLVAEVSGKVINISDHFLEGSYFKKGEVLLKIDDSSYQNSLAIAKSDVAVNKASLNQLNEEEKSTKRTNYIAQKNLKLGRNELSRLRTLWKKKLISRSAIDIEEQKLNQLQQRLEDSQGKLNTYKSRKLAILARINAAKSRTKQEQLNIAKAIIKAPYAGRVLKRNVDVDQFVGAGTSLGNIYATSYVYVDLPLSLNQYELLGIPEYFENQGRKTEKFPSIIFNSTNSRYKALWEGKVVRTSAALDAESRQIKVIARINDPFRAKRGAKGLRAAPVRIGQYLDAKIKGKTFNNVYVLPSSAVRQNKEILLLQKGEVHIVPVDVVFNTSSSTIISSMESIQNQLLITTSMNQATDGVKVITLEEKRLQDLKKENQKKLRLKENKEKQLKDKQAQIIPKGIPLSVRNVHEISWNIEVLSCLSLS